MENSFADENLLAIWVDERVNLNENKLYLEIFREKYDIITEDNFENVAKKVKELKNKNFFIITSGKFGEPLMKEIHEYQNFKKGKNFKKPIKAIIFCSDVELNKKWSKNYPKIEGVYNDYSNILFAIVKNAYRCAICFNLFKDDE